MAKKKTDSSLCDCGSAAIYADCCGIYLESAKTDEPVTAPTAEKLMRSRYTAFSRLRSAYLLATWHPKTRPAKLELDADQQWVGLRITDKSLGGPEDAKGTVTFIARYKVNGKAYRLEEKSQFEKINGKWYYLSGEIG